MNEFYKNMVTTTGSDEIFFLLKNTYITIVKALIDDILVLEVCENQIFLHRAHPALEGYNPIEACQRVIEKSIENISKLSANQLTLPCEVLLNIIPHVILPRKGHRDEVNNFDLFILDSFLVG